MWPRLSAFPWDQVPDRQAIGTPIITPLSETAARKARTRDAILCIDMLLLCFTWPIGRGERVPTKYDDEIVLRLASYK